MVSRIIVSHRGFRVREKKRIIPKGKWMNDETQICHRCFLGGGKTSSAFIPFRTPPMFQPICHMSDIS